MCRDTNKFLELLKPEYNDAVRYCRALCASWSLDDAEDVLQQSLLRALESFGSLNEHEKFRSWFFKIITRVFYTSVRKHFWKKFVPMDNIKTDIPEIYPRGEFNEDKVILHKALSELSAKERTAVLLFEIADFSIDEIKAIQNENSSSAVKSRLSRARKKLKRRIEELEKNKFSANGNSNKTLITGRSSESLNRSFHGDLENETIKLIAELKARK